MLHTKNFFQGLLGRRSWRTNMARFMESGTSRCKAALLQRYCNSVTTPLTPLQHTQDVPSRDIKKIWNIFHQSTNHYNVIFWWFSRIAKLLSLPPITAQKQMQTAKTFLGILLMWKHILEAGFHWWQSGSRNSLWTGSLFGEKKKKRRRGKVPCSNKRPVHRLESWECSWPSENKKSSCKWSHKCNGIGVRRIRTFPFLSTLLTLCHLHSTYELVKSTLSWLEAEVEG